MNTDKRRSRKHRHEYFCVSPFRFLSVCICVYLWLILLSSCGSKPTDLRTLIPADSLVYLESNDLGAVMKTITDRPAFREAAKTVPDFSVLNGVKLAVAVTGFETKEQPVTDEAAVLNFQPRFVAILETNAWNYQALAFTEQKLGEFINNVYGGEVLLETSDKHDGKYFVWKANDGRKAYALVQGSVVFFGNDETAIEKSLAVKRGEADAISKNPKITNGDRLAFGYVSPDGVAQIANVLGVKYASEASDEPEVRSAVSGLIPQILRNSVKEVVWEASKHENGIEDKFSVTLDADLANVFSETLILGTRPEYSRSSIFDVIPESFSSVTRYSLKNPRIAWRSVLLATTNGMDQLTGSLIVSLSKGLFEPYGIEDPEKFLGSIEPALITVRLDNDGQRIAVIVNATARDFYESISKDINFNGPPDEQYEEGQYRVSKDRNLAINSRSGEFDILGNPAAVSQCTQAYGITRNWANDPVLAGLLDSRAPAVTVGFDSEVTREIVKALDEANSTETSPRSRYFTETNFNRNGIDRRMISDFGLIGWIITQFDKE